MSPSFNERVDTGGAFRRIVALVLMALCIPLRSHFLAVLSQFDIRAESPTFEFRSHELARRIYVRCRWLTTL